MYNNWNKKPESQSTNLNWKNIISTKFYSLTEIKQSEENEKKKNGKRAEPQGNMEHHSVY